MSDLLRILVDDEPVLFYHKKSYSCVNLENDEDCVIAVPYEYDSFLQEICAALRWQGGTRQQVIEEIKRLKSVDNPKCYGVMLTSFNSSKEDTLSKIRAIKAIRNVTGKGLYEAKQIVDNSPCQIVSNLSQEHCCTIIQCLNSFGIKSILTLNDGQKFFNEDNELNDNLR
jgi:hypothetical protein